MAQRGPTDAQKKARAANWTIFQLRSIHGRLRHELRHGAVRPEDVADVEAAMSALGRAIERADERAEAKAKPGD